MTDASEKLDPTELRTLTLTNAEIGNLLTCVDGALRGQGLQAAETCLALAAKLSAAKPISHAAPEGNRHERRKRGAS